MPPKKQQQQNTMPYKPLFVLPVIFSEKQEIKEALEKPINIKKDINKSKIIQILAQKGLQAHIQQGKISQQGRKFVCENYQTVCQEIIQALSKPADPKKDAKKDTKKQAKKQQPVSEPIQLIQYEFDKKCNDFFLLLDFPANKDELRTLVQKGINIDIVVIIKEKIKPGSWTPDYSLLKNDRSINDLQQTLHNTSQQGKTASNREQVLFQAKQMTNQIERLISKSKINALDSKTQEEFKSIRGCTFINVDYLKDLKNSQKDQQIFLGSLFKKLCETSIKQQKYDEWKAKQKVKSMVQPIKQTITKQIQVQSQDKGKKGGKAQPVTQTVQEVVQTKYQSFPQNIKSQLNDYMIIKSLLTKVDKKIVQKPFELLIRSCIGTICPQNNRLDKNRVNLLADKIRNNSQIRPINQITPQILSNNVRQIIYPQTIGNSHALNFDFVPIPSQVSLVELNQKALSNLESLRIQFIVYELQKLAKKHNSKIRWDFSDRKYIERLSSQKLHGIINQQLLNDPQIYAGILQTQGLKLLILTKTNPPGRVLYHNSIFQQKVIPDFENWEVNSQKYETQQKQYYDYSNTRAGNLSICCKNMMPRDDSIIKDLLWTIGSTKDKIIEVNKNSTKFGITKTQQSGSENYIYWHYLDQQFLFRANSVIRTKQIVKQKQPKQIQGQQKSSEQQNVEVIKQQYASVDVTIQKKGQYIIYNNPYPTIFWTSTYSRQTKRTYSSNGEVTSYLRDGSIIIMYPNGNISTYKNGSWSKIIGQKMYHKGQQKLISCEQIVEGELDIKIRQDQTIIIDYPNKDSKIIFPDETQIYFCHKEKSRQIKSKAGPLIRIYLHRDYDLNVIGYGSAFAYLGFKNILERSYDGYLFQIFDHQITSHYYIQTFQLNGKICHQEMRLITFKDSSIVRIQCTSGKAVYLSPSINNVLTEQYLNERWLQLYTTPNNHGEGVFDIDLKLGKIQTKDSETNHFIAKINDPSESKIAVSFVKQSQEEQNGRALGNGFHVKPQNYFLPPPVNFIPPRLFSLHSDGTGCEYLNASQIGDMNMYQVNQRFREATIIRQYCRQVVQTHFYLNPSFTVCLNIDKFGMPDILKAPKTQNSLIRYNFPEVKHRMIEQVIWNSDYSRVKNYHEQILDERNNHEKKMTTIKTNRKIDTNQ